MPLHESSEAEHLILDPNFHLSVIKAYGGKAWGQFVGGNWIYQPEKSNLLSFFDEQETSSDAYRYTQRIVSWDVPDFTEPPKRKVSLDTEVILESGAGLGSFVTEFPTLFKKYNHKQLKNELDREGYHARDAGHEMFPGVGELIDEAADYLNSLLVKNKYGPPPKNPSRAKVYNMYLMTGYNGEDDLEDFVSWLVETREKESDNDQEILKNKIFDCLSRGLSDAFADAVEYQYSQELRKAIEDHPFPLAKIKVSPEDDSWHVTVPLGDLINIAIKNTVDSSGNLNYPDVGADVFSESLYGLNDQVQIPNEYPYPDNVDYNIGYEYFSEEFPDEILNGTIL